MSHPRGEARALLVLVNRHRAGLGLHSLTLNKRLRRAARIRALQNVAQRFLSHDGWVTALKRTGYFQVSSTVGENLASGHSDINSAFEAWLASPDHRRNIEDPDYREMGFARIRTVRVQTFGAQR